MLLESTIAEHPDPTVTEDAPDQDIFHTNSCFIREVPNDLAHMDIETSTNPIRLRSRSESSFNNVLRKLAQSASYDHPPSRNSDHSLFVPPASTTFLILEDRPSHLPQKDDNERKRHSEEYAKLQSIIKQKRRQEQKNVLWATETRHKREKRQLGLLRLWRREIIPHWKSLSSTKRVRHLIWEGIPSAVRRDAWWLLSGNALNINHAVFNRCLEFSRGRLRQSSHRTSYTSTERPVTQSDDTLPHPSPSCSMCSLVFSNLNSTPLQHELCLGYKHSEAPEVGITCTTSPSTGERHTEDSCITNRCVPQSSPFYHSDRTLSLSAIKMDVSRTFPSLGLFQPGNPYHYPLHDLLAAYVAYKPDIGYVQGMSFLAAILLLVMEDAFEAFVMFANILERPCHRAFYSMDEEEFVVYFRAFDQTLADRLPRLHAHFKRVGLEPNMYLFDWLFTIFSRSLPLEADMRVWDLFFLDGELALFRAALGVLQMYEQQLLQSSFDQLATFLTSLLPSEISADCLVKQMRAVGLKKKSMLHRVAHIRTTLILDPQYPPTEPSLESTGSKKFFVRCASLAEVHPTYLTTPTSPDPTHHLDVPSPIPPFSSIPALTSPVSVDHSVVSLSSPSDRSPSVSSDEMTLNPDFAQLCDVPSNTSRPRRCGNGCKCSAIPCAVNSETGYRSSNSHECSVPPKCASARRKLGWGHLRDFRTSQTQAQNNLSGSSDQRLRVYIQRFIERVP